MLDSAFLVQNAYSVVIYFTRLEGAPPLDIPEESVKYAFLDKIPAFIIHSAYIKICQYK